MPRKSAAALESELVQISVPPPAPIEPPEDFTEAQKERWDALLSGKPWEWLDADSRGLLIELVRAESQSELIAQQLATIAPEDVGGQRYLSLIRGADIWSKQQVNLCRALRLSPHTRMHARTAARQAGGPQIKKPWET